MQTQTEDLTRRYERIIIRLLDAIGANNRVFPLWLTPLLDRLVLRCHCGALTLLGKLAAGLYRRPRPRSTPRPAPVAPPPADTAPPVASPAFVPPRAPVKLPTTWKWLARALPSPMWEAARACAVELQQLLSEPDARALFAAAPALRTHLRPVCRALGVTLPDEPPPPDAGGPEPPPPPAVLRPLPEIGDVIHGRPPDPPPRRACIEVRWSDEYFNGIVTIGR